MNHTAQELFEILNDQDECTWIEALGESTSSHSVMETVCAFANEPRLGGGYIIMGIAQDTTVLFQQFKDSTIVSTQPIDLRDGLNFAIKSNQGLNMGRKQKKSQVSSRMGNFLKIRKYLFPIVLTPSEFPVNNTR